MDKAVKTRMLMENFNKYISEDIRYSDPGEDFSELLAKNQEWLDSPRGQKYQKEQEEFQEQQEKEQQEAIQILKTLLRAYQTNTQFPELYQRIKHVWDLYGQLP